MTQLLSIERREGDVITNPHMKRLANEGFSLRGFTTGEGTWVAHFVNNEDQEAKNSGGLTNESLESLIALGRSIKANYGERKR